MCIDMYWFAKLLLHKRDKRYFASPDSQKSMQSFELNQHSPDEGTVIYTAKVNHEAGGQTDTLRSNQVINWNVHAVCPGENSPAFDGTHVPCRNKRISDNESWRSAARFISVCAIDVGWNAWSRVGKVEFSSNNVADLSLEVKFLITIPGYSLGLRYSHIVPLGGTNED